jgi:hypothetical protein
MSNLVDFLGDIGLQGALKFLKNEESFPASPSLGTLVLKEDGLFGYIKVGDLETWYPFSTKTRSYIHTQGAASTTWTVNHQLGASDVWYQVYGSNGNPLFASRTIVNNNTFTINLVEAATGTVVVVGPDSVQVPVVNAQSITVGNADEVVIDNSGVRINGEYALTAGSFSDVATSGSYNDLTNKPSFATVATSGSYVDLTNKPTLFSGSYNDLTNKPSLFDGAFSSLIGTPTTVAGYGITDAVASSSIGAANGIASLDGSGKVPSSQLPSYVDDVLEYDDQASFPVTGSTGVIYVAKDVEKIYRWSGSTYVEISSGGSASSLATARTIQATGDATWSVTFDGSENVSAALTLANSGATAGTYKSVTVDAKGRVTAGTNPTTLSDYGITDAQPLDADLTAIATLAGTSGILKKTAADTWSLDTNTYLTANQSITFSGDASGSGSTTVTLTLANSGATAGTYKSVTVDAKGRVTAGTNPTTLSGYGITDAAPAASPTFTGAIASNGSVRSAINAISALDIDCSTGNYFTKTIAANSTFTFSNVPNSVAYAFTLRVDHTSGTISFPASVTWNGGNAPSPTTGKTHLFMFVTEDGGTKWRGAALVDYTT